MDENTKTSKWEGKVGRELQTTKAEQIWPLFEDFCSIHKWLPSINTCHYVEGVHGQPGLVRYCESSSSNGFVKWCHEKLISIDHAERCLSYEVKENNVGFTYYVAELKVIEIESGCKIEWSFVSDPIEGWRLEDLCGYIESSLKTMAERMEMGLQAATN
ncbi:lachrymatory-factor synthase-like [Rutidosis leptorrhynchoides]|uniref:lachrymatory-factor synthase-like n=1 Tax=Rutidosis leptorrhynchoides TaxID=125765 RepID=UPI003A99D90F